MVEKQKTKIDWIQIQQFLNSGKSLRKYYKTLEQIEGKLEPLAKAVLGADYFNCNYRLIKKEQAAKWILDYLKNTKVSSRWNILYEISGWAYFYGIGIRTNYRKSFECHRIASKTHPISMHFIADAYFESIHVPINYRLAFIWYKKVNNTKYRDSMIPLRLGYMSYNGIGTKKNITNARRYYEKSDRMGNDDAKFNLVLMDIHHNRVSNKTRTRMKSLIKSNYKKSKKLKKWLMEV